MCTHQFLRSWSLTHRRNRHKEAEAITAMLEQKETSSPRVSETTKSHRVPRYLFLWHKKNPKFPFWLQNNPCVLLVNSTQGNLVYLFFNTTKITQYLELGVEFLFLSIVIASSILFVSCANICLYVIADSLLYNNYIYIFLLLF